MAITYNNTTAGAVSFNSTDLDKVTYNGVEVFTKVLEHKIYVDGRSVMSNNFITIDGTKYTRAGLYTTTGDTFTVGTNVAKSGNHIYLNGTQVASGDNVTYTMPSLPDLNYKVYFKKQETTTSVFYYIYIDANPTNNLYIPNEGNYSHAYVSAKDGYNWKSIYTANSCFANITDTVKIHVGKSNSSITETPKIYLNGEVIHEGTDTYTYTITGDCTVTFVRNPETGSPYYYDAYITT